MAEPSQCISHDLGGPSQKGQRRARCGASRGASGASRGASGASRGAGGASGGRSESETRACAARVITTTHRRATNSKQQYRKLQNSRCGRRTPSAALARSAPRSSAMRGTLLNSSCPHSRHQRMPRLLQQLLRQAVGELELEDAAQHAEQTLRRVNERLRGQ